MGPDEKLCIYVPEHERQIILIESYSGTAGGHYAGKTTV